MEKLEVKLSQFLHRCIEHASKVELEIAFESTSQVVSDLRHRKHKISGCLKGDLKRKIFIDADE